MPVPSVEVTGLETETGAENEPEVIGNTKEQALEVELPVVWSEDGHAVAHFTFEFNDEIIEVHQPEETWGSVSSGGSTGADTNKYYRVRKSWEDAASQKGASCIGFKGNRWR